MIWCYLFPVRPFSNDLWCHPIWSSDHGRLSPPAGGQTTAVTEIRQFNPPIAGEEDTIALDVTMDNIARV